MCSARQEMSHLRPLFVPVSRRLFVPVSRRLFAPVSRRPFCTRFSSPFCTRFSSPFCTRFSSPFCTRFSSPVNSLIATVTELLNSYSDVIHASMYPRSVVIFTAPAFCTECGEPYLHCLHKAGGALRSRQRGLVYNQRFVSSVRPSR